MTNLVDIVSSRGKAELIRSLFGLNQPELRLRELGRLAGLSSGTGPQELRRHTRVGLVTARKNGNDASPQMPPVVETTNLFRKSASLRNALLGTVGLLCMAKLD